MAAGLFEQTGLPGVPPSSDSSIGPGTGGGIGTGSGTGVGAGRGSGFGDGAGGGTGGGIYRPGGAVTAPRLIDQVTPRYTPEALARSIQGTVLLEAVVTPHGTAAQIRVVRSLDPGLDIEAVAAVEKWRFEPGRLAGRPVSVLVTIMVDFWIR
jgi:TonB family protein